MPDMVNKTASTATEHLPRCTWATTDPLLMHYHDTEWGIPERDPRMLWETLMLEGFQAGLYDAIWQAFAVLLPVRTVGVMGDGRTYDQACALRAVTSTDGMTADVYPFTMEFLTRVAGRIVNEVRGINRVTYDITSKPPGTIEWE